MIWEGKSAQQFLRKEHHYLGMTQDYGTKEAIKVIMKDYIATMVQNLPQHMIGTAVTPALNRLFDICTNGIANLSKRGQ